MRFYSENGEDIVLWNALGGGTSGFYVDVGAMEGQWRSNSLTFEEAGWDGVCVEAHPLYYELLAHIRKCTSIWAAVGSEDKDKIPFKITHYGAMSSLKMDLQIEIPWNQYFECALNVNVPMKKLDTILEGFGNRPIDFVSIDVEGSEVDAMKGFTLDVWKPRIVVIEVNREDRLVDVDAIFSAANYMRSGELSTNRFYFRDIQDADRVRNVSVDMSNIYRYPHPLEKAL